MPKLSNLFTSESVSEGHPDKIADQISDAVLDAILAVDPEAKVACETLVKTGMVLVAGEIATHAWVDIETIVRDRICAIGYDRDDLGFSGHTCAVINAIGKQSPDIAMGVTQAKPEEQGAGDQGLMFGYACDETKALMPAPIDTAHRLMRQHAKIRQDVPWIRPDAKAQVTFLYEGDRPVSIHSVVLSTQHDESVSRSEIHDVVMEQIILPVLGQAWLTPATKYYINPTGRFVIGGPVGDCGLTGRKIIVDTYGGMARHGGGCFSGKDPSKVDRSAAYAARYVAKHLVAAGLAKRCEVQLAYAIGVPEPVSIRVDTFGTGSLSESQLVALVNQHFDLRPGIITRDLKLRRPIYLPTAAYGHFGREDENFTWEQLDRLDALRASASQLKKPHTNGQAVH